MRKIVIILACMLVCLSIFSGCTDDKDNSSSGTDIDNSVEIDIDTERKGETDVPSDDNSIVYELKDPENADGIVVVPKE